MFKKLYRLFKIFINDFCMYELKNITLTLYIPNILDLNRLLLELLKDNQNYV